MTGKEVSNDWQGGSKRLARRFQMTGKEVSNDWQGGFKRLASRFQMTGKEVSNDWCLRAVKLDQTRSALWQIW